MQPQIVNKPAFTVVGLRIRTKPMSPEIPQLWDQLVPRIDEIAPVAEPQVSYGLMEHNQEMTQVDYMAGNPVEQVVDLPAGMTSWDVPPNTYAVFETTLSTIGETFGSIYNTWLPTSGYQQAAGPYFERYPETFPDNPTLSIYIPGGEKGMTLRVVGAGLPRTSTHSLQIALEQLLGGRCYHMREIPGHPFDLGTGWKGALAGDMPDWDSMFDGYNAAVDWPASMFWRELSAAYPDALVLLSVRDSAETWWQSAEATILPVARLASPPNWNEGDGLTDLLERFAGTKQWDDPATLQAAYERHNAAVRQTIPPNRLFEWRASEGWEPICRALGVPAPDAPFPWTNRRENWR